MRLISSTACSLRRLWQRPPCQGSESPPRPRDPALRMAVYLVTGLFAAAGAHNVRQRRDPPAPPATAIAPAPQRPAVRALRDGRTLDLNRASAADLRLLPGIGPRLSARIVAHRRAHGSFSSVNELQAVPGIGPKTLARLRPHLAVRTTDRRFSHPVPPAPRP